MNQIYNKKARQQPGLINQRKTMILWRFTVSRTAFDKRSHYQGLL